KGNVLIVDDEPINLHLLSNMLVKQGYEVHSVTRGVEALEVAQSNPPDIVLLDIYMPEMDGYEVCQRLKADERTRDIPVIFISALEETHDKVKAFGVGGVDYITKPFKLAEVLARVETHLALRELQKQLQETNQELAQSNAELQARNKDLDAFSHTVAHDLKNPIVSVVGYADMLRSSYDVMSDQEIQQALQVIIKAGYKMNNIVQELLVLAGLRHGDMELQPLNMAKIVDEALQRLSYTIEKARAEIITPDTWPSALGYAPWVEEVWANYISNGIKYGGQPPRLELGATEQSNGVVRFWVRDDGAGLTPEEQSRLFTSFKQLEQVRATGHGLGLSIVQHIVEKLGGQVGVESEKGKGSLFYFTLPASPR
ncbi:MAG: hybrid sensor histidine kinase/response regulator, partial [Chloroflexi bacterium]